MVLRPLRALRVLHPQSVPRPPQRLALRCGFFRRYSCGGSSPRIRVTSPFFLLLGLLRRLLHNTVDATSPLAQPLILPSQKPSTDAMRLAPSSAGTATAGGRLYITTMGGAFASEDVDGLRHHVGRLLRTEKVLALSAGMGSGIEHGRCLCGLKGCLVATKANLSSFSFFFFFFSQVHLYLDLCDDMPGKSGRYMCRCLSRRTWRGRGRRSKKKRIAPHVGMSR